MFSDAQPAVRLGRRALLKHGVLVMTAAGTVTSTLRSAELAKPLKVGLVTDLHYADKPPAGTRYYRQTLEKLARAADEFAREHLSFLVELGDFIDAADSVKTEIGYLKRINRDFSEICKDRHYVLGNHCVFTLTKQEFLEAVERPRPYYSFDAGDYHFVILDSCFRSDGTPYGRKNFQWTDPNVPAVELEWLRRDLQQTSKKTIVFAHQRLDVANHYGVKNAAAVRAVLEKSGKVLAVFQGHSHRNDYREIGGIHYCTLVAMVEGSGLASSGHSVLELRPDDSIRVRGFLRQSSYDWS